jgi:TPR repeat protein
MNTLVRGSALSRGLAVLALTCCCAPPSTLSQRSGTLGPERRPSRGRELSRSKSQAMAAQARERRCYRGVARACYLAGIALERGSGVKRDDERAVELYRRACDAKPKGVAAACTNLGYMHARGRGVPVDKAKAVVLYTRGCNGGNALGCSNLGALYELGQGGLKRDRVRARKLYAEACKAGYGVGCGNLGLIYFYGRGVKRDRRRAQGFYRKACRLGKASGCRRAGWGELRGDAGPRDVAKAARAFARGCKPKRGSGDDKSCRAATRLAGVSAALGGLGAAACRKLGLWRPQRGRLAPLGSPTRDAPALSFATLRWSPALIAKLAIPARDQAYPRVALDDGRVRISGLLLPTRAGRSASVFLAREQRISTIVRLAPGFAVELRGRKAGITAVASRSGLGPLNPGRVDLPLVCDDVSLFRGSWTRPKHWPAGGASLGKRELLRERYVPVAATPGGKPLVNVRPRKAGLLAVLGTVRPAGTQAKGLRTKGKRTKRAKRAKRKPLRPTITVELLAKRGRWRQIRWVGHRVGLVGWVHRKALIKPQPRDSLSSIFGLGGLGLAGRGRGQVTRWRCDRALKLRLQRAGAATGKRPVVGLLHAKAAFRPLAATAGPVPIRVEGLSWLRLAKGAQLTLSPDDVAKHCSERP